MISDVGMFIFQNDESHRDTITPHIRMVASKPAAHFLFFHVLLVFTRLLASPQH